MTARATTTSEFRQRGALAVLAWPAFDRFGVEAMVTIRHGGVSPGSSAGAGDFASLNLSFLVGDDPANVLENRRRVAAAMGAELGDFVFAQQVHGHQARIVSRADRGRGSTGPQGTVGQADALVTSDPGTVLAILVADCVPIVLYDPAAHVLACVHAGWRGTVARVAESALAAMSSLGSRPADVIAGLGPAITADRYQVGDDVAGAAERAFGTQASSVLRPDGTGKWLFDSWAANRLVLTGAGVSGDNIHVADVPTGPDLGLFYSHRAQAPCGRFAAVARLNPRGPR
jgi:purine-nucleoside/S-methyl-5'-thioadenosine phosphorylase / adenosine deaminase